MPKRKKNVGKTFKSKSLRACAKVAHKYGLCLQIHSASPLRSIHTLHAADILQDEIGIDPEKTIFIHMDTMNMGNYSPSVKVNQEGYSIELTKELLDRGFNIGLDCWTARSNSSEEMRKFEFGTRKKILRDLVDLGYVSKITLGHDMTGSSMALQSGGLGYTVFPNALKEMVRDGMITEADVKQLTVTNPARILAFDPNY